MKKFSLMLTTGFALFSMFFGSGNLVFPLQVGKDSLGHFPEAALGIILTGVLVPFLGVFGMILFDGDPKRFFSCFGKTGIFLFSFASLALMGPFGVLARCLTVAHGALQLLVPGLPLVPTSLGLCLLIFVLTYNKHKIVSVVGAYLTPFLLASIATISYFGYAGGAAEAKESGEALSAFTNGFFQGYQTMDLLAAFFFSTFIISHLKGKDDSESKKYSLNLFLKSSLIGAGLLGAVYFLLVMLGSFYSSQLAGVEPKEMLGKVALLTLGPYAAPVVAAAVVLACLTTAIVLTVLFADFVRYDIAKGRIGNARSLSLTLAIGFLVSTLDFGGIASFLGPILETVYPALILLTVVNIAGYFMGFKTSHWPVTAAIALKLAV